MTTRQKIDGLVRRYDENREYVCSQKKRQEKERTERGKELKRIALLEGIAYIVIIVGTLTVLFTEFIFAAIREYMPGVNASQTTARLITGVALFVVIITELIIKTRLESTEFFLALDEEHDRKSTPLDKWFGEYDAVRKIINNIDHGKTFSVKAEGVIQRCVPMVEMKSGNDGTYGTLTLSAQDGTPFITDILGEGVSAISGKTDLQTEKDAIAWIQMKKPEYLEVPCIRLSVDPVFAPTAGPQANSTWTCLIPNTDAATNGAGIEAALKRALDVVLCDVISEKLRRGIASGSVSLTFNGEIEQNDLAAYFHENSVKKGPEELRAAVTEAINTIGDTGKIADHCLEYARAALRE